MTLRKIKTNVNGFKANRNKKHGYLWVNEDNDKNKCRIDEKF